MDYRRAKLADDLRTSHESEWISLSGLVAAEWLPEADAVVFLTDQRARRRAVTGVTPTAPAAYEVTRRCPPPGARR